MPRLVAGPIWAIRLTVTLTDEEERQLMVPGTVCVYHHGGFGANGRKTLFQDKPHYHIYYNSRNNATRKEEVQKMVKSNSIVAKYYKASNGFWSVETDEKYDLDSYWQYVWKDFPLKKQRLVWWCEQEEQLPKYVVPVMHPLVVSHVGTHVVKPRVKKSTKTSLEKQQLFLEYCKEYYEDNRESVTKDRICRLLISYCSNAGFSPESSLSTWARFAYFNLLDKDSFKMAQEDLADKLEGKFF